MKEAEQEDEASLNAGDSGFWPGGGQGLLEVLPGGHTHTGLTLLLLLDIHIGSNQIQGG